MSEVGIAALKARLSEFLRRVRRGESLTVLDRKTPVARLVPYPEETGLLRVRHPAPGSPSPGDFELPPPTELDIDVVELILEDRGRGR